MRKTIHALKDDKQFLWKPFLLFPLWKKKSEWEYKAQHIFGSSATRHAINYRKGYLWTFFLKESFDFSMITGPMMNASALLLRNSIPSSLHSVFYHIFLIKCMSSVASNIYLKPRTTSTFLNTSSSQLSVFHFLQFPLTWLSTLLPWPSLKTFSLILKNLASFLHCPFNSIICSLIMQALFLAPFNSIQTLSLCDSNRFWPYHQETEFVVAVIWSFFLIQI